MLAYLFVYGTLRSGFNNRFARLLRAQSDFIGPAQMRGRLHRVKNYPGLRPSLTNSDLIAGELYRLRQARSTLTVLDAYEAREYRRVVRTAAVGYDAFRCWVYLYLKPIAAYRRIPEGQWLADGT